MSEYQDFLLTFEGLGERVSRSLAPRTVQRSLARIIRSLMRPPRPVPRSLVAPRLVPWSLTRIILLLAPRLVPRYIRSAEQVAITASAITAVAIPAAAIPVAASMAEKGAITMSAITVAAIPAMASTVITAAAITAAASTA
jgi:hypothetical protein